MIPEDKRPHLKDVKPVIAVFLWGEMLAMQVAMQCKPYMHTGNMSLWVFIALYSGEFRHKRKELQEWSTGALQN